MTSYLYTHYVRGNGAPPLIVALVRAVGGGVLLGASSAMSAWQANAGPEQIAQAFCAAVVGYFVIRAGVEGWIDKGKSNGGDSDGPPSPPAP